MRRIKRYLLTLCFAFVLCCAATTGIMVSRAAAVSVLTQCNSTQTQCGPCNNPDAAQGSNVPICKDDQSTSSTDPLLGQGGLLTIAVNILSIIVGVAAVIVIIIAGLRTILSAGDPQSVSNARKALIYALVGLAVAAAAQALVAFVLNKV